MGADSGRLWVLQGAGDICGDIRVARGMPLFARVRDSGHVLRTRHIPIYPWYKRAVYAR